MTSPDDSTTPRGDLDLATATEQLRARPSAMPVEVADHVLERALATPRLAAYLRAGSAEEPFKISTVAVVALLRQRLEDGLPPGCAARRIVCRTTREEQLESVLVELIVQFGHDLRESAAITRDVVSAVLSETVGDLDHDSVLLQHVHVSDVTVGDPRQVDPFDED